MASNVLVLAPANQLPFLPWQMTFPNEAQCCHPPFILIKTARTVSTWCAPAAQYLSCFTRFLLSSFLNGATVRGNYRKRTGDWLGMAYSSHVAHCMRCYQECRAKFKKYCVMSYLIQLQETIIITKSVHTKFMCSSNLFVTAYVKTLLIRDFLSFQRTSL